MELTELKKPLASGRRLTEGIDLFLVSFAALFFEMVVIRWLASEVRVFAYLKNLPLLAAFLGLGVGCALGARSQAIRWFMPVLLLFCLIVSLADSLGIVYLPFPSVDLKVLNQPRAPTDLTWEVAFGLSLKFFLVVTALFALTVALFVPLGQRLGMALSHYPPLRGYTLNLAGSLLGVAAFAMVSFLQWGPPAWFALGLAPFLWIFRRSRWLLLALLLPLSVVILLADPAYWSPYYRIDVEPLTVEDEGGRSRAFPGYSLRVNKDAYQGGTDLSDAAVAAYPEMAQWRFAYDLPYRFSQPKRVLILGSGLGNDVAAALRNGVERVDAVDIDGKILELGAALHPEQPYASPRVRAFNDDARSFLQRTRERYDLIVFGLLDSSTQLSALSSLRLDNYVYTQESMAEVRAHLAESGTLALSYASAMTGRVGWLDQRLHDLIKTTFGQEPLFLEPGYGGGRLFLVGPGATPMALDRHPDIAAVSLMGQLPGLDVPLSTDDWPFLYLKDRAIPLAPYGGVLAVVLGIAWLVIRASLHHSMTRLDPQMFCLGAAFMLVETSAIAQLSLFYGSTWVVNSVAIAGILIMAVLANGYVAWRMPATLEPCYLLLGIALLTVFLAPRAALGGENLLVQSLLGTLLVTAPVFFSGIIFATSFSKARDTAQAFGSNLLGALVGGIAEYLSMITGIKALALAALLFYGASYMAWRWLRRREKEETVFLASG